MAEGKRDGMEQGASHPPPSSPCEGAAGGATPAHIDIAADAHGGHAPPQPSPPPNVWSDAPSILLLLVLYTLQGIPLGLAATIPIFLVDRGASYADQAVFSMSGYPYALKLLWAPVVDALYTTRFRLGQRKSWIIPMQLLAGALMFRLAATVDDTMATGFGPDVSADTHRANVWSLMLAFLGLYFTAATQDVAVDAWALTVLQPQNRGYASVTNTVGQALGIQLAYSLLIGATSTDFSNAYLRRPLGLPDQPTGIVTVGGFLYIAAWAFILTTCGIWLWKVEEPPATPQDSVAQDSSGPHRLIPHVTVLSDSGVLPEVVQMDLRSPRRRRSSSRSRGRAVGRHSPSLPHGHHATDSDTPKPGRQDDAEVEAAPLLPLTTPPYHGRTSSHADGDGAHVGGGGRGAGVAAVATTGHAVVQEGGQPACGRMLSSAWVSLKSSYWDLWLVLRNRNVWGLIYMMLTMRLGVMAVDVGSSMVMQQRGMTKEALAAMDTLSTPLQLLLPIVCSRWVSGRRPLTTSFRTFMARTALILGWIIVFAWLMPVDRHTQLSSAGLGYVFVLSNVHAAVTSLQIVAQMAFFAVIADESMGGTYITLLNTMSNLGGRTAGLLVLMAMQWLDGWQQCTAQPPYTFSPAAGQGSAGTWDVAADAIATCRGTTGASACAAAGGTCTHVVDGFLIVIGIGLAYTVVWSIVSIPRLLKLQHVPRAGWLVDRGA